MVTRSAAAPESVSTKRSTPSLLPSPFVSSLKSTAILETVERMASLAETVRLRPCVFQYWMKAYWL